MIELLHVHSGNLFGGVESSMVTMAHHESSESKLRSHYALCFHDRLSSELRAANAIVHDIGAVRISRPWTVLRARRRLDRLLRERRFDAATSHSSWSHSLFAPVIRAHRLPLVYWTHDIPRHRNWLDRWAALTTPDVLIANSGVTRGAAPMLFPGVRCELLYPPVPPSSKRDSDRARVRGAFGAPEDTVVIVMTSRLEPWKGHSLLLQALSELRSLDGWMVWIAGGPQRPSERVYLESLMAEARRRGIADHTRFVGERNDIRALLAAADIHCQPNTGPEPFGIAFVEALCEGLPVVTTAIGAALEIVDERCGVLVPEGEPAALAAALTRLIRDGDERRRLGRQAAARAAELCDPRRQIARLSEIVQGVSAHS